MVHTKMYVMAKVKENSTNSINRRMLTTCNLTYVINLMGGRWKLLLLMRLEPGRMRYGELKRQVPNITERMLTLQLREMEMDGLVTRTVYAEVPARVEYELTGIGNDLIPICTELHSWGTKHRSVHNGEVSLSAL